jgi:hypothetical protein
MAHGPIMATSARRGGGGGRRGGLHHAPRKFLDGGDGPGVVGAWAALAKLAEKRRGGVRDTADRLRGLGLNQPPFGAEPVAGR